MIKQRDESVFELIDEKKLQSDRITIVQVSDEPHHVNKINGENIYLCEVIHEPRQTETEKELKESRSENLKLKMRLHENNQAAVEWKDELSRCLVDLSENTGGLPEPTLERLKALGIVITRKGK